MLKKIISYFFMKLKGREFILDDAVRNQDIVILMVSNFISLIRGFIRLWTPILMGRNVRLYSKYNFTLARGVKIGAYCLLDALGHKGIVIGKGSSIGDYSILKVSGTLTSIGNGIFIGENVGIGEFAHIGGAGGVCIGSNTIAGAYLSIHPENHNFINKESLIREQGVTRKGISIGENCWIGAKVTILDGSVVGKGCVIAAGAVVNGIFPDNVVVGGVPAKILKER
jgi:acetyltransferase-like isoleucine patch superfamily enzyme